jgi:hypothetical protein
VTGDEFNALFRDDAGIDERLSAKLSKIFDQSPGFWARLDRSYRTARAAGKPAVQDGVMPKKGSGNIAVRVPSSLHTRLLELGRQEGTSLNQMVLSLLAEGVGRVEQRYGK